MAPAAAFIAPCICCRGGGRVAVGAVPAAAGEPPQQLKGFTKVHLEAGASTVVSLALTPRDFSIWSVEKHGWAVVSGTFGVAVGSSSRDHRLVGSVRVP